jgi:Fe2+ or Zn2+ uptake regulation protein
VAEALEATSLRLMVAEALEATSLRLMVAEALEATQKKRPALLLASLYFLLRILITQR